MATREDVVLDFEPSPRIAIVDSPSVEFVVQDIVDTLRKREDTFRGQTETKLINASGKEDLGGGVQVGITAELQDTQIAFEGRTTPTETGTVTTNSSAPIGNSPARKDGLIELIDINADYVTANIQRGSLVINFTDNSVAEVYSVISPTTLITRLPSNGATNTHQIGDVYHVFNIIQCELIGGNLVGADENGDPLTPVSPTAFTQVIRTASSSATLSTVAGAGIPSADENAQAVWEYQAGVVVEGSTGQIQRRLAFGEHIHVSANDGVAGTAYPLGTFTNPVNNIANAVTIGAANGIDDLLIDEDITVLSTDNIDGFSLTGAHAIKSQITVQANASTQLSKFSNCNLTGTLGGRVVILDSVVENLLNFEGIMHEVVIDPGGIQLSATANAISFILDSYSGVPGSGTPEIDFNNTTHALAVRAYSGGLKFVNKTQNNPVSVDFISGQLILDTTTTAGEIVVRGVYHLEDNSLGSPGVALVQNTNLDTIEIKIDNMQVDVDSILVTVGNISLVVDDLIKYQRNKSIIDPLNFTLTIYEDDGVTPLTVFDLQDDGGVNSVLSIFRRIPILPGSP